MIFFEKMIRHIVLQNEAAHLCSSTASVDPVTTPGGFRPKTTWRPYLTGCRLWLARLHKGTMCWIFSAPPEQLPLLGRTAATLQPDMTFSLVATMTFARSLASAHWSNWVWSCSVMNVSYQFTMSCWLVVLCFCMV